jgi:hypothetical protein
VRIFDRVLALTVLVAGATACGSGPTPPGQGIVRVGQLSTVPCESPDVQLGNLYRFAHGRSRVAWSNGGINLVVSRIAERLSAAEQSSLKLQPVEAGELRDKDGGNLLVACLAPDAPDSTGAVHAALRYVRHGPGSVLMTRQPPPDPHPKAADRELWSHGWRLQAKASGPRELTHCIALWLKSPSGTGSKSSGPLEVVTDWAEALMLCADGPPRLTAAGIEIVRTIAATAVANARARTEREPETCSADRCATPIMRSLPCRWRPGLSCPLKGRLANTCIVAAASGARRRFRASPYIHENRRAF